MNKELEAARSRVEKTLKPHRTVSSVYYADSDDVFRGYDNSYYPECELGDILVDIASDEPGGVTFTVRAQETLTMINITDYSDDELSTIVFNDESLYNARHSADLFELLDSMYEYSDAQMRVLLVDLGDDQNEMDESE